MPCPGIIGKKIGMTNIYEADGKSVACTLVEAGPCVITQIKNEDTDGYTAVQLGFGERKEKNTPKALKGHFDRASTTPKAKVVEFRNFRTEFEDSVALGNTVGVNDVFKEGDFVDAIGNGKGKGFQGVVKRHGFGGVGQSTHGRITARVPPGLSEHVLFPHEYLKECAWRGAPVVAG